MMFCTNCGARNEDDAKFCVSCGSPLSGGDSMDNAQAESGRQQDTAAENVSGNAPHQGKAGIGLHKALPKKAVIGIAAAVIAVAAAVVIGVIVFSGSKDSKTSSDSGKDSRKEDEADEEEAPDDEDKDGGKDVTENGKEAEAESNPDIASVLESYRRFLEQDENGVCSLLDLDDSGVPYMITCNGIYHYEHGKGKICFSTDVIITDVYYYKDKQVLRFAYPYDWSDMNLYVDINSFQIVDSCALDDIRGEDGYPIPDDEYQYYDVVTGAAISEDQYNNIQTYYTSSEADYHMGGWYDDENEYDSVDEAYAAYLSANPSYEEAAPEEAPSAMSISNVLDAYQSYADANNDDILGVDCFASDVPYLVAYSGIYGYEDGEVVCKVYFDEVLPPYGLMAVSKSDENNTILFSRWGDDFEADVELNASTFEIIGGLSMEYNPEYGFDDENSDFKAYYINEPNTMLSWEEAESVKEFLEASNPVYIGYEEEPFATVEEAYQAYMNR